VALSQVKLVGDVGGTKVHLALYENDHCIKEEKFPSKQFHSLSEIVDRFLDRKVSKACFAIAGPIRNQICKMTNLNWAIDAKAISKKIEQVHLLNDIEAAGFGLPLLKPTELKTVNQGIVEPGTQAIIAAGTGLGIGAILANGQTLTTEAGHVDFAPRDLQERQLWDYLHKKYGHVSVERVISGPGLEHLYWFLVEKKNSVDILEGEEIPRLIVENDCKEVLHWFVSLYGAAVGNVALQYLALGGVYIAGGVAPKILKYLQGQEFMRGYLDKGRFAELLSQIPVHVVLNEQLPLLGALRAIDENKKVCPQAFQ
jgi:glucokinase